MIGTAGLPHVIVRFFTVPRMADARSSAGWALVFIALLHRRPGRGGHGDLQLLQHHPDRPVGDPEANVRFDEMPAWMERWQNTG
jgi:cation/acetate symporter